MTFSELPPALTGSTELFGVLSDVTRRRTLSVLHDRDDPMTIAELATRIVAREEDKPFSAVSDDECAPLAIRLHHVHLPKLADHGLLAYDAATHTVTPRNQFADERDTRTAEGRG